MSSTVPKKLNTDNQKNIAYFKRKRGILKKAMELSLICQQDIYMVIFDRKLGRFVEFQSTPQINVHKIKSMQDMGEIYKYNYELYENEDYSKLNVKSLTKNQFNKLQTKYKMEVCHKR